MKIKIVNESQDRTQAEREAWCNAAIVRLILPQCYAMIDKLLSVESIPPKLRIEAQKLLPKGYKHSFQKGSNVQSN